MEWLERQGLLTYEERVRRIADLISHGRTFLFDADVLAWAVAMTVADGGDAELGRTVLAALSRAFTIMPSEAVARLGPMTASAVAAATAQCAGLEPAARERGVALLLNCLDPWIEREHPFSRQTSVAFWQFLAISLLPRVQNNPGSIVEIVLQEIAKHPNERILLRDTTSSLLEGLLRSRLELDPEDDARPLYMLLFDAIAQIDYGEERTIAPPAILRLIAPIFDLEINYDGQVRVQGPRGTATVAVDLERAEIEAANEIEAMMAAAPETPSEPVAGIQVRLEVDDPWSPGSMVKITAGVELIYLLHRVSPPARAWILASLESYYRQSRSLDIAIGIASHTESVVSNDEERATRGRIELLQDLLSAPRTWLDVDLGSFFTRLHSASFEQLHAMAGAPDRWLDGEGFSARILREFANSSDLADRRRILATAWGPFGILLSIIQEVTAADSDRKQPSGVGLIVLRHVRNRSETPYARILHLAQLLAILESEPDLRSVASDDGVTLESAARDVIVAYLSSGTHTVPSSSETVLQIQSDLRLHALVHRLVFRCVLTQQHLFQASAGVEPAAADPLGDLLLLGHILTSLTYSGAASHFLSLGTEPVVAYLERLLTQHPFSQGVNPVNEHYLPDSLGLEPPLRNPYLTTMLAMLETLPFRRMPSADERRDRGETREEAPSPFWWTPEVQAMIARIASGDAGDDDLPSSARAEAKDRFETITVESPKDRAGRLIERYGWSK